MRCWLEAVNPFGSPGSWKPILVSFCFGSIQFTRFHGKSDILATECSPASSTGRSGLLGVYTITYFETSTGAELSFETRCICTTAIESNWRHNAFDIEGYYDMVYQISDFFNGRSMKTTRSSIKSYMWNSVLELVISDFPQDINVSKVPFRPSSALWNVLLN